MLIKTMWRTAVILGMVFVSIAIVSGPAATQDSGTEVTGAFKTADGKRLYDLGLFFISRVQERKDPSEIDKQLNDLFQERLPKAPDAKPVEPVAPVTPDRPGRPVLPPPVAPPSGQAAPVIQTPNFKLTGHVWGTKIPYAIIDGEVVGIGDTVQGWTVVEIKKEGVTVGLDQEHVVELTP